MMLNEMKQLFLDSRKRGTTGARRKCSPKTLEVYERNLDLFFNFLIAECAGTVIYEAIKKVYVLQFLDWMDKKIEKGVWHKATKLQALRTLRTFFRWVDKDEECQEEDLKGRQNWLPAIEKCPRRMDIPEANVIKKFRNSFRTDTVYGFRDYIATSLFLTNGLRIGELCSLKIDNIKFNERVLIVTGKEGTRLVPITKDMVRLLQAWLKRRSQFRKAKDSEYVFISKRAERLTENALAKQFLKHRKRNGLPRISAHTFRHFFATEYLKRDGDMEKLRTITGHKSYEMLKDYLHMAKLGGTAVQNELERVNLLKGALEG